MITDSDNRKAFIFIVLSIGVFCAATQQLQQWNCGLWFCSAEVFSFFSKLTLPMSSLQALWGCDLPGDYSAFNFAATAIFVATDWHLARLSTSQFLHELRESRCKYFFVAWLQVTRPHCCVGKSDRFRIARSSEYQCFCKKVFFTSQAVVSGWGTTSSGGSTSRC